MTEQEWLVCTDPSRMLPFLRTRSFTGRKFRLFACACTRQIWDQLPDDRSRQAVILAERLAEGDLTRSQMAESNARIDAEAAIRGGDTNATKAARKTLLRSAKMAANDTAGLASAAQCFTADWEARLDLRRLAQARQSVLLRCVFGNPFRPMTFDPAWFSSTLKDLAEAIYEERRFADVPYLADALQDAGCTSQEMLDHCRQPGEHVRGCWPLDLILGKQ